MDRQNSNTSPKYARRMSADSGAPSSYADDNPRDETELKQPINRHVMALRTENGPTSRNPQYKNYTRHKGKSGHVSDTSSVTSQCPQSTDTEIEKKTVMSHLDAIIGKRASKKGKPDSSYNIHIGRIVINNNPKPDPAYYDHPPPAPCANNYTYINERGRDTEGEEMSEYYNVGIVGREGTEQGSTPRGASPILDDAESHTTYKINPYKMQTENFVTGERRESDTTPKTNVVPEGNNGTGYGFLMPNPVLSISGLDLNGKVEITLKTAGPNKRIWKGELSPQNITTEHQEQADETAIHRTSTTDNRETHENEDIIQSQTLRVSTAGMQQSVAAQKGASSVLEHTQNIATNISNTTEDLQERQQTYLTASSPGLQKISDPSAIHSEGQRQDNGNACSQIVTSPGQVTLQHQRKMNGREWSSEPTIERKSRSVRTFFKSKEKHNTPCCPAGFYSAIDEEAINMIKKRLCEQGKDCMWCITFLRNFPGHLYGLNIKLNGQVYSYPVSQDKDGKFSIDLKSKKKFPCLCKLIKHYKNNKLPNSQFNLGAQPFVYESTPHRTSVSDVDNDEGEAEFSDTKL